MLPSGAKSVRVDPEKLRELIENRVIKITPQEIDGNLYTQADLAVQDNISCNFLLIRCYRKEMREDHFIDFLYKYSAIYAVRYSDLYPENFEAMSKKELIEHYAKNVTDIFQLANSKYHKKDRNAGEMGEILLFLLLEARGYTQLLNKMSLKTSPNDAIRDRIIRKELREVLEAYQMKLPDEADD